MSTVKQNVIDELNVNKELFMEMVNRAGFKSMRQFALKIGMSAQNLCDRISGRYAVSVPMMYVMANALGCTIDDMVRVFYPDLWAQNHSIANRASLDRAIDQIEIKTA